MRAKRLSFGCAGVVELQRRDADTFLVNLGGIAAVAAGDLATDIGMVGDGDQVARQPALPEDRLHDVDVGEMGAAGVGVVEDEDIAGVGVVAVGGANRLHGVGDGAEM